MTDKSFEILCKPILDCLYRIEEIVGSDDNEPIFEINKNASITTSYDELLRLRKSLEQYVARKGILSYVGFLGHFSAGKSRTINSLIDQNRPVGNHPTDMAITLITHESNAPNIIAAYTQGELAIGRALYDNEFLKNTVIIDTPGSGDPSVVEELVRDFLPVCDRLIYTFSAASPLDRSDLPVLQKARSELPFIPIDIVITRADEFRKDPLKPLSEENFDESSAAEFKAQFCMRLLKDVYNISVSPEDILLIDNIVGFNINQLKSIVVPKDDSVTTQVLELHSHKVRYFAKSSKRLRDLFADHIDLKLEALGLFLSSARNNHDVYQTKTTMANNRLTEYWRKARSALDEEKSNQTNWIRGLDPQLEFVTSLTHAPKIKPLIEGINSYIVEYAEQTATKVSRNLQAALQGDYDNHIVKFRKQLDEAKNSSSMTLLEIELNPLGYTDDALGEQELPFRLKRAIQHLPQEVSDYLDDALSGLSSVARRLQDRVKDRKIVAASRLVVVKSIGEIESMLDGFLDSVRLYRSAILAMHTRHLAEEAGIVSTIDALEKVEIPSNRRDAWLDEIVSDVFPSWSSLVADQDSKIASLLGNMVLINKDIMDFRAPQDWPKHKEETEDLPNMNWIFEDLNVANEIEKAVSQFINMASGNCQSINNKCAELMAHEREQYREDGRIIRENRKKMFRELVYAPIATIFVGSIVYLAWWESAPNSWGVILIGNVLSTGLVLLLSKAWDRTNMRLVKREKRHTKETRDVMEEILDDANSKLSWPFIDQIKTKLAAEISGRLKRSFSNILQSNSIDIYGALFDNASTLASRLKSISGSYEGSANDLAAGLTEYYTKVDLNLEVLAEVSAVIRQEAIEPSFVALNERNAEFINAKNMLTSIEIGAEGI